MTNVSCALLLGMAVRALAQSPAPPDANVCLESLPSTGCMLRWEIDASTVTGSSSQTNTSTTPNILFTLDDQWRSPKAKAASQTVSDKFASHLTFKTGYTQVPVSTKIQPAANASGTMTPLRTATIPQRAVIVAAGGTFGWTMGQDGHGAFTELGGGVRGSFQDIIPNNQIVQSGGLLYIDLSSANARNAVGLYEATAHFKLSSLGHDKLAKADGNYDNVSDLLVIEAGYQNNSGLDQLIASSPQTNTRSRFVGRFYAYPEISSANHTKILVGIEYSGGINGGPKIIQVFLGTNVNPAKLLHPTDPSAPASSP
jgi:hypothetical protein